MRNLWPARLALAGLVLWQALAAANAAAALLQVGPGKPYSTIAAAVGAAVAGDTIEIDAGIYPNETMGIAKDGLTLRGVGGRAHLKWGTGDYLTNTATIGNGKGILVVSANNVTIENLEFSGAKVVDENGAGIRYEGGNLTIRGSYFHQNENGIMGEGGSTSTLLIEKSILERNGYCPTSCAHNVYIGHMGRLVFRFNKSIDSKEGHTLKSRANVSEVIANYFSTKNSDGSYEADFPNGGTVYFIGNVIEQGVDTGNPIMLAYGDEGATNPNLALHIVNNTFSNLRGSGAYVSASGSPALTVKNNIFSGGGSTGVAADASNKALAASNFVDVAASDYHLAKGSAAIDAGVDPGSARTYALTPQWEYVEPADSVARTAKGAAIDIGAYEFAATTGRKIKVTRAGSGSGAVLATDGSIDCGATCIASYDDGSSVTLTATPASNQSFTGWLGPCTGNGSCTFTVAADADVTASFTAASLSGKVIDVDQDDRYDALSDGLIVLRYLFGLTGVPMVAGAVSPGAGRGDPAQIAAYLVDVKPLLDVDGDGRADALTDGVLLCRYLFGLRGASLTAGAVGPNATRATAAAIETYIGGLSP